MKRTRLPVLHRATHRLPSAARSPQRAVHHRFMRKCRADIKRWPCTLACSRSLLTRPGARSATSY